MGFDVFLYVALGAGIAVGLVFHPRSPWILWATQATIVALLFFLGASLSSLPPSEFAPSIGLAFLFVALVLGFTILASGFLPRPPVRRAQTTPSDAPGRVPFSIILVASVVVGYAVGLVVAIPADTGLEYALYALLFLVGVGLHIVWHSLRRLWAPLTAAGVGAAAAGGVYALATGTSLAASFAVSFGFGWYSLDGPLVTASLGAALGLVAFLTNFLRENLTMLLAPVVGHRFGAETITSMGGATSMDTTLFFVVRYGDPDAATMALASGLILTVAASLLVPAFLILAH